MAPHRTKRSGDHVVYRTARDGQGESQDISEYVQDLQLSFRINNDFLLGNLNHAGPPTRTVLCVIIKT